jgi:hypothetical protein
VTAMQLVFGGRSAYFELLARLKETFRATLNAQGEELCYIAAATVERVAGNLESTASRRLLARSVGWLRRGPMSGVGGKSRHVKIAQPPRLTLT